MTDDRLQPRKIEISVAGDGTVRDDLDATRQSVAPASKRQADADNGLVGQCLNDQYLIQAPLGSGGMSVVYKALNKSIDKLVAVKTIKLSMTSDPIILARFEREIKSLGRLNHPNIVTVYDCVLSTHGQPYVVMDYIEGSSFDKIIHELGPVDQTTVARIFVQVCAALEHAHRHGIVHRDLKPANIMIASSDLVKVVDFGLAKIMEENQRLTSTGQLWGSVPYMSPEQCSPSESLQVDHRTDIYSLGVAMYEALMGEKPFSSENIIEIVAKHLYEEPVPFKKFNPAIHVLPNLEAVVFTALRKNKEERFQSMKEMKEAIEFAAAPLFEAQREALVQSQQQAQHKLAQSKKSGSTTAPKKTPSLSAYLDKKKRKDLKIPIAVACSIVCTLGFVYFLGAFNRTPAVRPTPAVTAPAAPVPAQPDSTATGADNVIGPTTGSEESLSQKENAISTGSSGSTAGMSDNRGQGSSPDSDTHAEKPLTTYGAQMNSAAGGKEGVHPKTLGHMAIRPKSADSVRKKVAHSGAKKEADPFVKLEKQRSSAD